MFHFYKATAPGSTAPSCDIRRDTSTADKFNFRPRVDATLFGEVRKTREEKEEARILETHSLKEHSHGSFSRVGFKTGTDRVLKNFVMFW
ncbi:uncharacterized, partial [Tachysurus ichikawai]